MTAACSNEFEDVHKMQFLYPYNCLIQLDTSSSVVIWGWENMNAFKFLTPLFKINLVNSRDKALNCNQMFVIRLKQLNLHKLSKEEERQPLAQKMASKVKEGCKQFCLYLTDEKG